MTFSQNATDSEFYFPTLISVMFLALPLHFDSGTPKRLHFLAIMKAFDAINTVLLICNILDYGCTCIGAIVQTCPVMVSSNMINCIQYNNDKLDHSDSQKTPDTSPSQSNYGTLDVTVLRKMKYIFTSPKFILEGF